MLSTQLINEVVIDWEKIGRGSYLRDIPALCDVERISFTQPVTFFVGENGSGFRRAGWGYFLRAESFYNVATKEEEYSREGGVMPEYYHHKSHGESFLALAQKSFKANGLYLLDEPEAALSPQRQLTLLVEIDRCAMEGSQFIIVTHSPILLGMPGAEILSFDDGPIHPCAYEETDSYQVTSMFINHREQMLRRLLTN